MVSSLKLITSASRVVMSLDIVNCALGLVATIQILRICKNNPRRIVPNDFTPDDHCLNGYLFGPIVSYITFIVCGVYFMCMDNTSETFQKCLDALG